MNIFIKAGFWINKKLGFKGEFNLTKYIQDLIAETPGGGVTSVNTLTGEVVLTTNNILEATDKNYVTDAEKALINTQVVSESDYLDIVNGYTVAGQNYTFLAGWIWVIDGVTGYTNVGDVIINFPLTAPTFSRIDAVVATTANTFVRIAGTPSTTTPASPAIPSDTVFVLFVTVDDVAVTVIPGPPGRNQVSNQPYNATTWNNVNNIAPSKNAVRDKFESFSAEFIPLTGTTVGNPVSGDIELEILDDTNQKQIYAYSGGSYNSLRFSQDASELFINKTNEFSNIILGNFPRFQYLNKITDKGTRLILTENSAKIDFTGSDGSLHKGLEGSIDFSPNITDLDYTQKIYVDNAISGATGGFIPITGTTVGNPVSGTINFTETGPPFVYPLDLLAQSDVDSDVKFRLYRGDGGGINIRQQVESDPTDRYSELEIGSGSTTLRVNNNGEQTAFNVNNNRAIFSSQYSLSRGITGGSDFSPNITDLDYTQKIYVDQKVADSRPYKVYTALVSQNGDGSASFVSGNLIIGKRYEITNFVAGDDFSNVANVVVGTINTTGCQFIAIGTTATVYTNGSLITDTAAPVAKVLENTFGTSFIWARSSIGDYTVESTGQFTNNKTTVIFNTGDNRVVPSSGRNSVNQVFLTVMIVQTSGTPYIENVDNKMFDSLIEIRVYN